MNELLDSLHSKILKHKDFAEVVTDAEIEALIEAKYNKTSEKTDTCEWIKYDYRTIVPKYHDADNPYWRIPINMDKLKYCPYCSKEIVVK